MNPQTAAAVTRSFLVSPNGDGRTLVRVVDARYSGSDGTGWATRSVIVP